MLAFEGTHFSKGAFEFARRLNELQPVLRTGVFLPQKEFENLWSYADALGPAFIPMIESSEWEIIQQNIRRFEKLCRGNEIKYCVHKDFCDLVLPELKKESHYADLLILGSKMFYKNIRIHSVNKYLEEILYDIACPVLFVPERFDFPESIYLQWHTIIRVCD